MEHRNIKSQNRRFLEFRADKKRQHNRTRHAAGDETIQIAFDKVLPKWTYTALPTPK